MRVLVADDEPIFRALMLEALEGEFDVTLASDGAEAFYLAQEDCPRVAVLDAMMPGWDGLMTMAAFRANPELRGVPIIMLTNDVSREGILDIIASGADDYLIKSEIEAATLLDHVRSLCGCGSQAMIAG